LRHNLVFKQRRLRLAIFVSGESSLSLSRLSVVF
jgi:hypothetical protein